jgi:hypothetical protein
MANTADSQGETGNSGVVPITKISNTTIQTNIKIGPVEELARQRNEHQG